MSEPTTDPIENRTTFSYTSPALAGRTDAGLGRLDWYDGVLYSYDRAEGSTLTVGVRGRRVKFRLDEIGAADSDAGRKFWDDHRARPR